MRVLEDLLKTDDVRDYITDVFRLREKIDKINL